MRKLFTLIALLSVLPFAGTGCKYLEQKNYERNGPPRTSPPLIKTDTFSTNEIEQMADAIIQIKKQRGTSVMPPMPPAPKAHLRAMSVPLVPDKYIVVRWDTVDDPFISYRVRWTWKGAWGPVDSFDTPQTKLDLVALFRQRGVPPGWYRIDVEAVNEVFLTSDPVTAVNLLWLPQ